jgi:hypothetical protein
MKICVPSSNRSKSCTTNKTLKNAIFFVPENQYNDYVENIDNEVVSVPSDYFGITKTRNFILNYYKNENIIFIDDDVRQCGYYTLGNMVSLKYNCEALWLSIFEKHFELTKDLGFKIWGCESATTNFANHPLQPFSFIGIITCNLMGIINDGEFYFDENFKVKEDYDLVLRHFRKKGGHLKTRQFYWANKHWTNKGGCVDYRTDELESEAIDLLKKRYGLMVQKSSRAKNKHQISIKWG